MSGGIVRLAAGDRRVAADAACLHRKLLPESPVVRLGNRFMRRFYYHALVGDGLVVCDVAYHRDAPAGFLAWTGAPSTFMSAGLRNHFLGLAGVLLLEVLSDPRRLKPLLWTAGFMRQRSGPVRMRAGGELLSFGVLPEYRTIAFRRETGRQISWDLFGRACAWFQEQGIESFQAVVEARNREALMFYQSQDGCTWEPSAQIAGRIVVTCRPAPERGDNDAHAVR